MTEAIKDIHNKLFSQLTHQMRTHGEAAINKPDKIIKVEDNCQVTLAFRQLVGDVYFGKISCIPDPQHILEQIILVRNRDKIGPFIQTSLTTKSLNQDDNHVIETYTKSEDNENHYEMFEKRNFNKDESIFVRLKNGTMDHVEFNSHSTKFEYS